MKLTLIALHVTLIFKALYAIEFCMWSSWKPHTVAFFSPSLVLPRAQVCKAKLPYAWHHELSNLFSLRRQTQISTGK